MPGTIAATSQLLQVTSTLASLSASPAPSRLLACPVRNIAQATVEPWYIVANSVAPRRRAVGPGRESKSSAIALPTGITIDPDRAVIDGTPAASVMSLSTRA